ncbi:MAG: DUF3786 domain-containing protein [Deltaproteobacteria bacterium]|nr:DUF3786 domain-containing protein [Deltaproteobacteria bacterium]
MPRVDDYQHAFEIAQKELKQQDPADVAKRSGATYVEDGEGAVSLTFIDRGIVVRFSGMQIEMENDSDGGEIPIQEKVLVLHYLLGAQGQAPSGRLITYREIPSGEFYFPAFKKRAIDPMVAVFGQKGEAFQSLAAELGGSRQTDLSGLAYRFVPVPLVPITLQLHEADDEFPASGNVLFDETVSDILSLEDVAWLSGMIVYRLMGMLRNRK